MWNRNRTLAALGLVFAASFLAGLLHLLAMRAETGTFYPPYSTFRADPLGARAFYEGLRSLPGLEADRNLAPIRTLGSHRDATCLFLGDSPARELPESVFEMVEEIPARGGRLVLAFAPQAQEGMWLQLERELEEQRKREAKQNSEDADEAEKTAGDTAEGQESEPEPLDTEGDTEPAGETDETAPETEAGLQPDRPVEPETEGEPDDTAKEGGSEEKETADEDEKTPLGEYAKLISLKERWGVDYAYTSLQPDGEGGYTPLTAARTADDTRLPENLEWHSAMYFQDVSDAWRRMYAVENRPVAIERDFGMGTIVFLSDSFFFSNEAMREARHPGLLAWVVGNNRRVIFDETHLGIQEASGVMVLARQYRMHGLFAGLVVLALLYVWKSTCPLTPRYEARGESEIVAQVPGRDAVSGLANLLKRSIPRRDLLSVCLAEWRQAFGRSPRNMEKLKLVEAMAAKAPDPLHAGKDTAQSYKAIATVLAKREVENLRRQRK